jgi:hypothetical protein
MINNENIEDAKNNLESVSSEAIFIQDAFRNISEEIKRGLEDAIEGAKDLNDIGKAVVKTYQRDINKGIRNIGISLDRSLELQEKLNSGATITNEITKERERLSNIILNVERRIEAAKLNNINIDEESISALNKQKQLYEDVLVDLEKQNTEQRDSLGLTGKLLAGLDGALKTLDKSGTLSSTLDIGGAIKDTNVWSRAQKGGVTSLAKGGMLAKNVGGNLLAGFKGIDIFSLIMGGIVNSFLESDKIAGDLAKSLNVSYNEAARLKTEFTTIANQSGNIAVTSKGVAESFSFVNNELGISTNLSQEMLSTMTKFAEASGISRDISMATNNLILGTNQSLEDATGEIMAQSKITSLQNGVLINSKEVQKEIASLSAATTLSLSKNPKELAKAVTTAKSLGMEMSQLENISDSLLNFESSISSELEAELLLGKQLNLEKARQAALDNDLVTLSKELSENIGTSADFAKMNRIQQEALASSMGMGREEIAKTLYLQDQLRGYTGDEAEDKRKILESQIQLNGLEATQNQLKNQTLDDLDNQLSTQEKFNKTVLKLKEIFVTVADTLMPVLGIFTDIFSVVGKIIQFLEPVIGLLTGIAGGFAVGGPVGAIIGGITGGISDISRVGDMSSPSKGKTQVSTKEGGLYELSDRDDLVAAPNIIESLEPQNTIINRNKSTTNIEKEIVYKDSESSKETNSLLKQILSKQAKVKIDSTDIGTALSINSFSIQ